MSRKLCTCGSDDREEGEPHGVGCAKYVDRSPTLTVLEALRRRYSELDGEWLFYREVWRIDGFALRCWSSGVGYRRIAFEVKVSRGDFLSELRKPSKREGALALSHQFFFVTPKGLVRPDEVPSECGLMYVDDRQRTRIVKQAPVRSPRALTLSEAIYLMRVPLYREGLLEMRRKVVRLEEIERHERETRSEDVAWRLRVEERLDAYGRHLVTVGSSWRGLWQPMSWRPGEGDVEAYVEKAWGGDGSAYVALRRLDTGEIDSFVPRRRLLSDFVPLDGAAVAG